MAMVGSRDRPREGARGAQRTYRGGPEKGYRGEPALQGGGTALQGGHGSTGVVSRLMLQGRQAFLIAADVT